MSVKLHVGNISFNTSNQDLSDLFATVGSVTSCSIIEDRVTGRSRGFAFIEMSSKAESENAIAQLNGREIETLVECDVFGHTLLALCFRRRPLVL